MLLSRSSDGFGLELIALLLIFIAVLIAAYFAAKWVGGYQKLKGAGTNVEVLESCRIAPQKFVAVTRIGKRYFALAVGKDELALICELEESDITLRASGEKINVSFSSLFKELKKKSEDDKKID